MSESFKQISVQIARGIKLVMTDVDGTIAAGEDDLARPHVVRAIRCLEDSRISVGLVSGRTLPELDRMARHMAISGPIIAENGGIARLKAGAPLIDLGYSRQPALEALRALKGLYPTIKERIDNKDRLIDVVIFGDGIPPSEMRRHIGNTQLVDSGYILHLMQTGISKGNTLKRLLDILPGSFSGEDIMVFGDSLTDLSLFEHFAHSVLVRNPLVDPAHRQELERSTAYVSEGAVGEGFVQVVTHLLSLALPTA